MNTVLIVGFIALSSLAFMALKLYWIGLPAVCQ